MWTLVHGDDYCSVGPSAGLDWLQTALQKRYEIKTQRIGVGNDMEGKPKLNEGQVLNRVIRRTDQGFELEADLRHAELIIEQLGLDNCKEVSTAGVDLEVECAAWSEEPEGEELPPEEATRYRAIGARCNYLQPDRPDIQYAVKEVCRLMSRPTTRAWEMLKRVGRYLKGRPRLIWKFDWQGPTPVIDITSDANWAGCRRTRKSTSGGTIMIGAHLIRAYSKTQSVVAKSPGESELYAIVRASTEGLGIVTLLNDFGEKNVVVSIGIDATAAMGMAQRVGLNKVRHVEVDVLWIQEQQARKLLPLRKIPGPQNPSDLCTKNVPAALVEQYMGQLGLKIAEGRAAVAQQLHALLAPVRAHPEVGVSLIGNIGGRETDLVSASSSVGGLLGEVVGGQISSRKRQKPDKKTSAQERCVDSWSVAGEGGVWRREHRTPRRTLFTPHKVSGGPDPRIGIKKIRVTKGCFISTKQNFQIIDDDTLGSCAHRMLASAWTGTTEFRESENYIEEIDELKGDEKMALKKKSIAWADLDSDTEDSPAPRGNLFSLSLRESPHDSGDRVPEVDVVNRAAKVSGQYANHSCGRQRAHRPVGRIPRFVGARLPVCARPICHSSSSAPTVVNVTSSDAHGKLRTVGVGECLDDTGRFGHPYGKRIVHRRAYRQLARKRPRHTAVLFGSRNFCWKTVVRPFPSPG